MALFNFEDCNIRCFYQRLKDYYASKGWDSIEGLAKLSGAGGNRKAKLVRLAANIVEKAGTPKPSTKGTLAYYPVGNDSKKQSLRKNEGSKGMVTVGLMKIIAEEMVEEEPLSNVKQVEDSPREAKSKKSKCLTQQQPTNKKKMPEAIPLNRQSVNITEKACLNKKEIESKKEEKNSKVLTQSINKRKQEKAEIKVIPPKDTRGQTSVEKGKEYGQHYSGLFSKALITNKPAVNQIDHRNQASHKQNVSPPSNQMVKSANTAVVKQATLANEKKAVIRNKVANAAKDLNKRRKPSDGMLGDDMFQPLSKERFEPESSEDGPPRKSISNDEVEDDLEIKFQMAQMPISSHLIDLKTMPNPVEAEEDKSMTFGIMDISQEKFTDTERFKELANFDDEVSGELFDSIELKKTKEIVDEKVPVISDNVAEAVLAPIDEVNTVSSEEDSQEGYYDSDFRSSLKSTQLGAHNSLPRENLTANYQMQLPLNSQLNTLHSSFYQEGSQSFQQPFIHSGRKSSISQLSHTAEFLSESPQNQAASLKTSQLLMSSYNNLGSTNNLLVNVKNDASIHPELVKKNSTKKKQSNTTSSVVSRDSSSKPMTSLNSNQMRKHSITMTNAHSTRISTANSSMVSSGRIEVGSYDEFYKRVNGLNAQFSVLYCSLLLLNRRDKEALKEINYQFQLAMLNDDLYTLGQMSRLKALMYLQNRKLDEALKFLDLYKGITRIFKDDLGQAIAMFSIGYCKFSQNDMVKAKIAFQESHKRYGNMKHLFGEYYSIRNLIKIFTKEKKEKEAKEFQERLRSINSAKNIKNCINGAEHKKGTFILRTRGEMLSIMIEAGSPQNYIDLNDREKFKIHPLLKTAAELTEEYCK